MSKRTATAPRERPIIMSAESIRAILAGRKRQTRRVVKLYPWMARAGMSLDDPRVWVDPGIGGGQYLKVPRDSDDTVHRLRAPWGVEDRLWVKEAVGWSDDKRLVYLADGAALPDALVPDEHLPTRACGPMFMRRVWCRLVLEVVEVRVERLHAISARDAEAEGFDCPRGFEPDECNCVCSAFEKEWDALNKRRGYPWASNPYVWVVEFRRVERESEGGEA